MTNIIVENGIASVNGITGEIIDVEIIDDKFVHISLSGIVIGQLIAETTINNESFSTVESFADKLNSLKQ